MKHRVPMEWKTQAAGRGPRQAGVNNILPCALTESHLCPSPLPNPINSTTLPASTPLRSSFFRRFPPEEPKPSKEKYPYLFVICLLYHGMSCTNCTRKKKKISGLGPAPAPPFFFLGEISSKTEIHFKVTPLIAFLLTVHSEEIGFFFIFLCPSPPLCVPNLSPFSQFLFPLKISRGSITYLIWSLKK